MSTTRPIESYSRSELYDLIWSTPVSNLSNDFGISDVAIAKRCKRLNVPRPFRGYWTKIAAGKNPRKVPLPPTSNEVFKQQAQRRIPKRLPLPSSREPLIPLAAELRTAIAKADLDYYKRARLEYPRFPQVTISKNLAERAALSIHVLIKQLAVLGITFRKFQGIHSCGYFQRKGDRFYVKIEEDIVRRDGTKVTVPYWELREPAKPCGYLSFTFKPHRYGRQEIQQWSETAKVPLEQVLSQIVSGIRQHYLDIQIREEEAAVRRAKQHAEWLELKRKRDEEEAIRVQQQKEHEHAEALVKTSRDRMCGLLKSAELWRSSCNLLRFIDECEKRWNDKSQTLSAEQIDWLRWARV